MGGWARRLSPALRERVARVRIADSGHGYDRFGLCRDGLCEGLVLTRSLYERWFRVSSHGAENIPAQGAAVLASNHSGTLPFDGAMLWADVLRQSEPPRVVRAVMDHFVSRMPFVNTRFTRSGAVGGSRANVEAVLAAGQLLLIFPEGEPGISKPFRERYHLREFRVGHAELAIRHGVPVVPVAVIGAEEQLPQIALWKGFHLFGAPYLPIAATPFPLPVHYHIYYGAPIPMGERYQPVEADYPEVVREAAATVRDAVKTLIQRGLDNRVGVFR